MEEKKLQSICDKWKPLLGLNAWDISVALCHRKEMDNDDTFGEVDFYREHETAYVRILRPEEYASSVIKREINETLIHELLHIVFELELDGEASFLYERGINRLSRALHMLVDGSTVAVGVEDGGR